MYPDKKNRTKRKKPKHVHFAKKLAHYRTFPEKKCHTNSKYIEMRGTTQRNQNRTRFEYSFQENDLNICFVYY